MTGKWFLQEVDHHLKKRNRVVVLDPNGLCGFLIDLLEHKGYRVLRTDKNSIEHWQMVREELSFRHEAETTFKNEQVVFYVNREQSKLSFLGDYCHTHGCINLSNPSEWLRKKLFDVTGLQVQMDSQMLLTAAKLGVDKDVSWWKKIIQNLIDLIDVEVELQSFLHEPEKYLEAKDPDVRRLIEERFFEILGQPYLTKHPKILANEIVKRLFEGLVNNDVNPTLKNVYYKWADSDTFRPSLESYMSEFKLDKETNPWAAHPDHCFTELDRIALSKLVTNLNDKSWVKERLEKIRVRVQGNKVSKFMPAWWSDVITLLDIDMKPLTSCTSLGKVTGFYTQKFHHVDRAIRNLFVTFLNDTYIIRPLQEYYESLNHELLSQWFSHFQEYKTDQQGWLIELFKEAGPKTAVIVCDGLRYEIADKIADTLGKSLKIDKQTLLASVPSETETGMSALFVGNDLVLKDTTERKKRLEEATKKRITWMKLESLNYGTSDHYLGLLYGDIDYSAEQLQMGAIKLFGEFEKLLIEKITLLINLGYKEIHLVTDHGFVLTGLLDEADKIEPNATGKKEVHERFLRTVEKQTNSDWTGFEKPYGEYKYVYFARSHRPFKTTGSYGYSHGGITPQELIIPAFVIRKPVEAMPGLEVIIDNIKELGEVAGNIFAIRLRSAKSTGELFASSRKVKVLIYDGSSKVLYTSNIITIEASKTVTLEFSFEGSTEVKAVVLDAETKEQLDSVIIKKSSIRDTGGLF